jgi:trans-aconitate methyltransferase
MDDYKSQATNPQQYDSPELDWRGLGDENDSSRKFFREHLLAALEDISGKSVLDIGSGVGQLFPTLKKLGASVVQGIEPSQRNVAYSRDLYPDVIVHDGTLQNFASEKPFDVAICIMAFEHILDVEDAFSRIAGLLKPQGNFYLIIGDKEYNTQSRVSSKGVPRTVEVQELGDGVVATKTLFGEVVIHDIFRPLESVVKSAEKAGFELKKEIGLTNDKGDVVFHLLILKRTE